MIYVVADNIYTSLGFGSDANYHSVCKGLSGLRLRNGVFGVPQPFVASLFDRGEVDGCFGASRFASIGGLSLFEKSMILSASDALSRTDVDPASPRTLFVVSTTKGNVELLEQVADGRDSRLALWHSAQIVSRAFGNPNSPLVLSNACTSGLCAQIVADRALQSGRYDYAVVVGGDVLSKFVVSGFQSFKALSSDRCRPYDASRHGLNLGEAAATIVFAREPKGAFAFERGAIRNDANHISGPSRTAEGQYAALQYVMQGIDTGSVAFVCAHGTATLYNDDMESVALHRAALDDKPVTSLKCYFGHTLGAAGVLETIISLAALRDSVALPVLGYERNGVQYPLCVSPVMSKAKGNRFVKIISGFGGTNAAASFVKL